MTFSAVFGVAVYRICMLSVWSMNPDPEAKDSVRMTVTTTGIILNMLVVLVLEEVYGAIAVWLTELGNGTPSVLRCPLLDLRCWILILIIIFLRQNFR